jgi:hypothetical protein
MDTRLQRLMAVLSLAVLVSPLVAASAALAQGPECPACPNPASTQSPAPCHGTPLLTCCDDIATAAEGKRVQLNKLPLVALALPTVGVSAGARLARLAQLPDDLRGRALQLRLSVVLRL